MASTRVFLSHERQVAINAVTLACQACRHVAALPKTALLKEDASPVTVADYAAQAIVNLSLKEAFQGEPVVAEEDTHCLRQPDSPFSLALRDRVVKTVNEVLPLPKSTLEILDAIDHGNFSGSSQSRFWTLDPVDGTKGFLRGGQYAVCLALVIEGVVELGVMGCPQLPWQGAEVTESTSLGCLFIAQRGHGAVQQSLFDAEVTPMKLKVATPASSPICCESVEAEHSSHALLDQITVALGVKTTPLRMDSQCKYGLVARGDAHVYFRWPTRPGYVEKIWDHAAGSLLVEEAGGVVTDAMGQKLHFDVGRKMQGNKGILAAEPNTHAAWLKVVQKVVAPPTTVAENYESDLGASALP